MEIRFTSHAKDKLGRLKDKGVTEDRVKKIVLNPEKIESGYFGRKIAQSLITDTLVLRVVYEKSRDEILIITLYPGKRRRYK